MSSNAPQHQPQGNRTCHEIGHLWNTSTTVVKTYRRCTRAQCHAAERLVGGRWRAVPVAGRPQAKPPAMQPTLFRPGLDYEDRDAERRAERALFDLLRH